MPTQKPVGAMKKLVSIVDRGPADDYLYPADSKETVLQPSYQQYHNFSSEVLESNYTGNAAWGQRITFTVPISAHADLLQWCALVIKPGSWIPAQNIPDLLRDDGHAIIPTDINGSWVWASNLGQSSIALAELEVGGVVIDQIDGDWISVAGLSYLNAERRSAWIDSVVGPSVGAQTSVPYSRQLLVSPSEDGNIYCYLPFWFARRKNTGFPMCSLQDNPIRIHITLRPYEDVVRKWRLPRLSETETPAGQQVSYRDASYTWDVRGSWNNLIGTPTFLDARMLFGVTYLDETLRPAYLVPHEVLIEQVATMHYNEPLKYTITIPSADSILVGLPLTGLNGPIRRLFFFLRRKGTYRFNEWGNYGSRLEDEIEATFTPQKPLLRRAKLLVGTVVLADQPEGWWRYTANKDLPGGSRLYDNYVYSIAFDGDRDTFGPHGGTLNTSRVDLRLDLEVEPPKSAAGINTEWEVVVFGLGYNWLRFQNGIANVLYAD